MTVGSGTTRGTHIITEIDFIQFTTCSMQAYRGIQKDMNLFVTTDYIHIYFDVIMSAQVTLYIVTVISNGNLRLGGIYFHSL